jgi:membrane protein
MGEMSRDRVGTYAAEAAFFTFLSFLPFLMFGLAAVHLTPFTEADVLREVTTFLPPAIDGLAVVVINEVYDKSTTILSISAVLAVWSASRGIMALRNGLNSVYDVRETRNYFLERFRAMAYVVCFVVMLLLVLALLVFGNGLQQYVEKNHPYLLEYHLPIRLLRTLATLLVMTAFFAVLYKFLPNRKARLKKQWKGAIFSSLGWFLYSYGFSFYIQHFSRISYTYGSLSTIIIAMLWLYFCMYIFFVGAQINAFRWEKRDYRLRYKKS